MAKKKSADGPNKSEAIRAYLTENKDVGPKDAAAALTKQLGSEVTPNYVSMIKGKMGGGTTKGKRGKGKGKHTSNGDVASHVVNLKAAVAALGGAEATKKLIDVL